MSKSEHVEDPTATREFSRREIRRCRFLLRRLRFLETKIRETETKGVAESGGEVFAVMEAEALEWVLTEVGFLREKTGNDN